MVRRLRNIRPNLKLARPNLRGFISVKYLRYIVILILVFVGFAVFRSITSGSSQVAGSSDSRVDVEDAIAIEQLNSLFTFPIKDSAGEEVSTIEYEIVDAEIRNQLIIQGEKKTTKKGRTFLVLNLKITNGYEKAIDVITRNYLRLSVNGNEEEWLAPDVHNDPVTVQAISTKPTRLAFLVNDTDEKFVLQIGEITGEKQRVELTIKAK